MSKKLLIVESPTKARTIGKYLGTDFEVVATVGHLRDLPSNKMGVDMETMVVDYTVSSEKKKVVAEILAGAKRAGEVLLATDPDREGEAISWHVKWIIENNGGLKSKVKNLKSKKISRVTFHEITKEAISEALGHAREIDQNLVDAQQGRRVLDRMVGYSLSPVLWKKVRRGLSAGRVQSVAVRLIVEREKEVEAFKKESYFKISVELLPGPYLAELIKIDDKSFYETKKIKLFDGEYTYSKSVFQDKTQVDKFIKSLNKEFLVEEVTEKEVLRTPLPAFTTSKLQQAASRRMGWSGKQTMSVAQKLYEQGLITYHRTDSLYLSEKATGEFRNFIEKEFGKNYVSSKVRVYKNTSKNAQEAHEAIRPTNVYNRGESLEPREQKLYEMIWERAVATQATGAKTKNTVVIFSNGSGLFRSSGVRMLFNGFLKITGEKFEEQELPHLSKGQKVNSEKVNSEMVETSPPPRYSDASLVGALERQGIGRPSTYAPIITTIIARQYVDREEGKFKPTSLGQAVNEFLVKNFADIMSLPFTTEMEEDLDKIALGQNDWKKMLKKFWTGFDKEVKGVEKNAVRVKVKTESLGEKCPECNEGNLVIRLGKFGKFVSCDRFPECKYTRQFKELAGFKCPTCGLEAVVKKTKTGRKFFGCSNYPTCKWAGWKKP